jgi:uncharacterized membrane protein YeiB
MPLYVLSAGATAVFVVVLCLVLADRHGAAAWLSPLVATGQLALTNYVAHVVVGMSVLEGLGWLGGQTLPLAFASAVVFCVGAAVFSQLWRKRHARGPVETVMRRLTG